MLPWQYEGKSAFQTIAVELYKQRKTTEKKEHKRLVRISVWVDVVANR